MNIIILLSMSIIVLMSAIVMLHLLCGHNRELAPDKSTVKGKDILEELLDIPVN